jgi:hypothetical protein
VDKLALAKAAVWLAFDNRITPPVKPLDKFHEMSITVRKSNTSLTFRAIRLTFGFLSPVAFPFPILFRINVWQWHPRIVRAVILGRSTRLTVARQYPGNVCE